jgi:hypothetical protein
VSDIFREVEEEVRRERLEKIWKEYGDYITAAAALLILGAAGFQLWRYHEAQERAKASVQYLSAMQALDSGQSRAAADAFARLSKDAPGGYARLSELQAADAMFAAGNKSEAVTIYRRIAAGGDEMLGAIARIRAAWAIVDDRPKSDIVALVAPLTDSGSAWHPLAAEVLAYADYRAGQTGSALSEFKRLESDPASPPALKQRAKAMATFLAAGGDHNAGTVPQPVVPKPAGLPTAPAAPAAQTTNPQGKSPR